MDIAYLIGLSLAIALAMILIGLGFYILVIYYFLKKVIKDMIRKIKG